MKLNQVGNAYRRILWPIILFVIAIICGFGAFLLFKNANKGYLKTEATIVEIKVTPSLNPEEPDEYQTFVDYEVDGVQYTHIDIKTYESSYKVGKVITILYNPNNPAEAIGKLSTFIPILLVSLSGAALVGGVVSIVFIVKSSKKKKALFEKPLITSEGREIGEMQKLYFSLDMKTHVKLRFYIEDEYKNLLYEGKMEKFNLVGAHTYVFTDNINHHEEEHKVGHVNDAQSGDITVSQGFTFDGVEMTEYLDANKISIEYGTEQGGISYNIYHEGQLVATAVSSSKYVHEEDAKNHPLISKFRLTNYFFQIKGQRSYIDVIFLVLFKEALSPRLSSLMG